MHHPKDRITHTTAFVTPVVEHWLEREIAQWANPMKDRSDDPSRHERTLYLRILGINIWRILRESMVTAIKTTRNNHAILGLFSGASTYRDNNTYIYRGGSTKKIKGVGVVVARLGWSQLAGEYRLAEGKSKMSLNIRKPVCARACVLERACVCAASHPIHPMYPPLI